ncbi:MAG: MFS transporter, partial [Thermoanaerobaculales bacterium]|nr:MFS transporter [Thermoanaerobaculales bacterium]
LVGRCLLGLPGVPWSPVEEGATSSAEEADRGPAGGAARPRRPRPGRAFDIRPGERVLAWLFFVEFLLLTTVHFAAKSVRQATFIDSLGAENLPWVYLAVAVVSFPVLLLYSRLAERIRLAMLVLGGSLLHVVGLVAFFLLFDLGADWVAVAYYLWLGMAFAIAVSQFWTYANQVFDSRQARRLFSFFGAGGLLGSVLGGLLAIKLTRLLGTRYTLLGAAVVMLVVPILVVLVERHRGRAPKPLRPAGGPRPSDPRSGLRALRGSRLLGIIALLMLATVMIDQLVQWQFYWYVEQNTKVLDERTSVIGLAFVLMGVIGFLFQVALTGRIHRVLGVGFGLRVMPGSVAVAQLAVVAAIVAGPAAVYPLVWVLFLSEGSLRHGVDQVTRELLFLPVAEDLRVRAKAFIDVFVQRFGKGLAAVLILVTLKLLPADWVSVLGLVLAGAWLLLTVKARREYVSAFREGLKSGTIQPEGSVDPGDLTTVTTLVQALGSADERQVLHGLELLAASGEGRLVPPLLLRHDSPAVRRKTLEVLGQVGREDASHLVERALADPDAGVRTDAMRTLAVLRREHAATLALDHIDDPEPHIRATAMASLLGAGDDLGRQRAEKVLAELAAHADPTVRAETARALGHVPDPTAGEAVVAFLYDRDLGVVRAAIRCVEERFQRCGPNPLYATILISLMGNRRLKHEARQALVAQGASAIDPLLHFMRSPDEQIWVRRAVPKTIALIGAQRGADALLESLDAGDAMLRAKIIEALVFLRTRVEGVEFRRRAVTQGLRQEATEYLRLLADLWAVSSLHEARLEGPLPVWTAGARVPTLVQQLLAHRMSRAVDNIFGLLQLIESPEDVRAAQRSLLSGRVRLRARALEYLDNALPAALKRDVFAVIDDAPSADKLRRAEQIFGIAVQPPEATIERLLAIDPHRDPSAIGLVLAALYNVWSEGMAPLFGTVGKLAEEADDERVGETAAWVARRIEDGPAARGVLARRGDDHMAPMAQIEMMVFLQGVDLFGHCNAEEVLRLAAIAREERYEKGAVIFGRDDPADSLYCVVEGKVRLESDGETAAVIGPGGRFGVLDILSGRPRLGGATAAGDCRLLVIEAEDFFDLLSNNIEIVRALFRTVVALSERAEERLL